MKLFFCLCFTVFSCHLLANTFDKVELNDDGNNVLFIGRAEREGKDENNPDFLPNNLANNETKWLFIDKIPRKECSDNDLIVSVESDNFNEFAQGKFKAIITDSATTKFFISTEIVKRMISWLSKEQKDATLVIEYLSPCGSGKSYFEGHSNFFIENYWNKGEEGKNYFLINNEKYNKDVFHFIPDNNIFKMVISKTIDIPDEGNKENVFKGPVMTYFKKLVNENLEHFLNKILNQ